MPTQAIPDDVRRLIRDHLPTMSHVDVLVALARAGIPLNLERVVRRCYAGDALVLACLDHLVTTALVERADVDGESMYRLPATTPARTLAIQRLAEIANARSVTLVRFVYERPPERDSLFE